MADKKLTELSEQISVGANDPGYFYFVNKDNDSRKLSISTLKRDVMGSFATRSQLDQTQQDMADYVDRKVDDALARNVLQYQNEVKLQWTHDGRSSTTIKHRFYAPFNGIMNTERPNLVKWTVNNVDMKRYFTPIGYTLNGEQVCTQFEIHVGDRLDMAMPPAVYGASGLGGGGTIVSYTNTITFVPYANTTIDSENAPIMLFDATPDEIHDKIVATSRLDTCPFDTTKAPLSQMGVYGSNTRDVTSSSILQDANWNLVTNDSQSYTYYRLFCPPATGSYQCWYHLTHPRTGETAGTGFIASSNAYNTQGISLIDLSHSDNASYHSASLLKFKFSCIKILV